MANRPARPVSSTTGYSRNCSSDLTKSAIVAPDMDSGPIECTEPSRADGDSCFVELPTADENSIDSKLKPPPAQPAVERIARVGPCGAVSTYASSDRCSRVSETPRW